jgi:hypothetical protein
MSTDCQTGPDMTAASGATGPLCQVLCKVALNLGALRHPVRQSGQTYTDYAASLQADLARVLTPSVDPC